MGDAYNGRPGECDALGLLVKDPEEHPPARATRAFSIDEFARLFPLIPAAEVDQLVASITEEETA